MTRPTEIRIDRLVLPASEAGRAAAVGGALERSLAARLEGGAGPGGDPLTERIARAVAARIEEQRR
jgi:hypothetical protein